MTPIRFVFRPLTALAILTVSTAANAQTTAAPPDFTQCLDGLRADARAAGVSDTTYRALTRELVPDMSVIEKLDYQPEFKSPIWDYLSGLVDDERVQDGQAMMRQHADALERIQQRYGVDAATVVAVWGVESNFGRSQGRYPLVQALGTLSCYGRRQGYFRGELFSAMRILQSGVPDQSRRDPRKRNRR